MIEPDGFAVIERCVPEAVVDEASGYWPVILVMDHALAARVAGELEEGETRK